MIDQARLVGRKLKNWILGDQPSEKIAATFTEVFDTNSWGGAESRSGTGSDLEQTKVIRTELPKIIARLGARSVLDIPCGDFFWMSRVELDVDRYIGADVVRPLIAENLRRYASPRREFRVLDITKQRLPRVDIVFTRDCLVHLSFDDIFSTLNNLRHSGSKYFLTTTFTALDMNRDIPTGGWRPLNLCLPPFGLGPPLDLINEGCTENGGKYRDKSLGLWPVAAITKLL